MFAEIGCASLRRLLVSLPSRAGSVVEFNVPGAKNGGTDKGPNGHRIDSIPIANGVIKAGGACDIVKYFDTKHEVCISRLPN